MGPGSALQHSASLRAASHPGHDSVLVRSNSNATSQGRNNEAYFVERFLIHETAQYAALLRLARFSSLPGLMNRQSMGPFPKYGLFEKPACADTQHGCAGQARP